jgi:cytidylate kinase
MALITITTGIGCEGTAIGKAVADGLKLELYDDQRLQEEAIKLGIPPKALEDLDEKAPGLFSRLWSRKPEIYLDLMESVIYEVARRGEGVIMGHGAQLLLRDFGCALQVRIHASESTRVGNLMDQQGLSQEAATKMIHKSDSERRGFLQFAFHKDWDDPTLYDLSINGDKLSAGSAAKLIMEVAQSQEIKECSLTALDAMESRSLSKKIEAALIKNDISLTEIHIEIPQKGVALIHGWTYTQENRDQLLNVVKEVPGVSEVKSEVVVVPAGY